MLQCENRWRYLEDRTKKVIINKKQTGAAPMYFEYYLEMREALDTRPDIFPPLVVGNNVGKLNESRHEAIGGSDEDTTPKKQRNTVLKKQTDVMVNCLATSQEMAKQREESEKRKLDLFERYVKCIKNASLKHKANES